MAQIAKSTLRVPLVGTAFALLLTTTILLLVDAGLDAPHLVIGYLLPTTVIAIVYGSTLAFAASAVSSVAAAFFLFPPKFSLYIASPLHMAELGLFVLLALIGSKITALLTHDLAAERARDGQDR